MPPSPQGSDAQCDIPGVQAGTPPWSGARDIASALKSYGVAAKGGRQMIPDPPQPHATVEAFGLLQADSQRLRVGLVAHRQERYSRCLQQACQKRREGKEPSCWRAEEMKRGFKSQEL